MREIRLTTVTISHENGTYSATRDDVVDIEDIMQLIKGVLLSVGFSEEIIKEYIPTR